MRILGLLGLLLLLGTLIRILLFNRLLMRIFIGPVESNGECQSLGGNHGNKREIIEISGNRGNK
jgi:hypothetical protein